MCKLLRHFSGLFLAIALCFPLFVQAQSTGSGAPSLREQFDAMVRGSTRYQQYRVVPQTELNAFMAAVADTLDTREREIEKLDSTIAAQTRKITEQAATIDSRDQQIEQLQAEKDGIYLLGILVNKTTYNAILWTIILAALAGLIFFFLRARLAVSTSRELRREKEELTAELDAAKKRRLEVEQELRRKLQDEINKRLEE